MVDIAAPASLSHDQRQYAAQLLRAYLGSVYRLEKEQIPLSLPTFGMREIRISGDVVPPMPDLSRGRFSVPVIPAKGLHSDPTAGSAIAAVEGGYYTIRVPVQMLVPRRDIAAAIASLPTHNQVALSQVVIGGMGGQDVARSMRLGKTTVNDWVSDALMLVCATLYGERWGRVAA